MGHRDYDWEYTTENCVEGYLTSSFGVFVERAHVSQGRGSSFESAGVLEGDANAYAVVAIKSLGTISERPETIIHFEERDDASEFAALTVDYLSERGGDLDFALSEIIHDADGVQEWWPEGVISDVEPDEALKRMVSYRADTVDVFDDN